MLCCETVIKPLIQCLSFSQVPRVAGAGDSLCLNRKEGNLSTIRVNGIFATGFHVAWILPREPPLVLSGVNQV